MTHDPTLVAALQELSGNGITCEIVEDLRALADQLMQQEDVVALLDAQALGVPADAAVDAIKNQFPEAMLMVAGHAAEQNMLATRIAEQKVFRFVHKPASTQRLKLFVEAASQLGDRQVAQAAQPAQAGAGAGRPADGSGSMLPILAGIAGAAVLAIGGWMLMRKDEAPVAAVNATAAQPTPPEFNAPLERAERAFAAGAFVAADGSSAAELYREALRIVPGHDAATKGFDQSIERALAGAEQALLGGQLEQARVSAELLRLIVPDNSRLAFLNTQIERELARLNADATQRQALEAQRAQIRAAVAEVEQRIDAGSLIEPASDSAVVRFREAQSIGGGDPLVRGARDALVGALLTAADRELSADRALEARRFVEAAGTVNSSAPGLDFVRRRIDEALLQLAARSITPAVTAPAVVAPAVVTTPPAASSPPSQQPTAAQPTPPPAAAATPTSPATATAASTDGNVVVSANSLRPVRRVAPDYPQQALQNLVSGWVELEFTVAKDGSVRDVTVLDSEPGRTFDAAAVAALRRYRYEPVLLDGVPVEQRARLRMRFAAQDNR